MTNIADNVLATLAIVTDLKTVTPVVDETNVLAAIAALSAKIDALTTIVTPTPVA